MNKKDKNNGSLPLYNLGINKFIVTKEPSIISTVLGSCVSVCLYDQDSEIGGMNHYMLPAAYAGKEDDVLRFGNTSIPILINKLKQAGAKKIKAKIFGGANIFEAIYQPNISLENIKIAREILKKYNVEIHIEDVGGNLGRMVVFYPHSGLVIVKKQKKVHHNTKYFGE